MTRPIKVGVVATHPIQYQVPIWRHLAANERFDLQVLYCCDHGYANYHDPGFGNSFAWDIPLLEGYRSEFLKNGPLTTPGVLRVQGLPSILKKKDFDCVLANGYSDPVTWQLRKHKKAFSYKFVIRGEFTDERPGRAAVKKWAGDVAKRWFYRGVDAFCYVGENGRRHLMRLGVKPENMFFSPYNVDQELFESQKADLTKAAARRKLGVPDDAIVFLFSGKMIDRKNPLLLARAAAAIGNPNLYVIALGDGPLLEEFRRQLGAALGPRLITPGFVNQSKLYEYFVPSDVFVLPSRFDAWGLVVNEAMIFGMSVIVSDRVGCRHDLVVENETGFIFASDQERSLRNAMSQYLNDATLSRRLGANAQKKVSAYSAAAAADGIAAAICNTVEGDRKSSRR